MTKLALSMLPADLLDSTPEQEHVLSTLQQHNTHQDALYTGFLTVLPLFFALPLISTLPTSPLLGILGVTSLLISAGRMRFSSTPPPPPPPPHSGSRSAGGGILRWLQLTDLEHRLVDAIPENGPLRIALPWLNMAICAVLSLAAALLYRRGSSGSGSGDGEVIWFFCLLPGVAWVMVEVAVRSMRDVEKGVGELGRLRYRYKGA